MKKQINRSTKKNLSFSSQKIRTLNRKVFGRMKVWKWGTPCKSMWIKQPWITDHIPYSELARQNFIYISSSKYK